MKKSHFLSFALCAMLAGTATIQAQDSYVHPYTPEDGYIVPDDEQVLRKLDQWQDLKFGVLFHWGIYAVPGIVESWSLVSEDEDFENKPRIERDMPYDDYKKWYFGLNEQFNPVKFDPEKWADIMADAGMKYMVFTTKHHDGFCMFDSKYTDYSIAKGPFADNPRSNVAKEVFDAFRAKDFMIGAYFSKPDWHCPWYWHPRYATPDRNPNYNTKRHPDWWKKYVEFTQNQLAELTTDYGHIDILWLDGGQINGHQIGLDDVLKDARQRLPGLISVDRACRNEFENYQTPECTIPPKQRNVPWETNMPLDEWGWHYEHNNKSTAQVIAMLTEVVAKGGNFLLGIGPSPEGEIEEGAQVILHEVGQWLRKYGKAIYGTRNAKHYNDGQVWFNASKDGKTLYAVYAYDEKEGQLPATIEWTENIPKGRLTLVSTGKSVKYKVNGNKVTVTVPKGLPAESFALAFKVQK